MRKYQRKKDIRKKYLVERGRAGYSVYQRKGKYAIFRTRKLSRPISLWWESMCPSGLFKGESEYYIAGDGEKYAIFHKDHPRRPVSKWWRRIKPEGVVEGRSQYYVAVNDEWRI